MIAQERELSIAPKDLYDEYRRQIEHEDNLVSQRSSWVLIAQSFLIVGYCIMHQNPPPTAQQQPLFGVISDMLAWVGLVTLLPILFAILGSLRAMSGLNRRFAAEVRASRDLAEMLTHFPPIQTRGWNCLFGQVPSVLLPVIFFLFWTAMIVLQFQRAC